VVEVEVEAVMKMRNLPWLFVCLLVIGCGKIGQAPKWPAVITSFGTMSEDEKAKVLEYVASANEQAGMVVIKQEDNADGYPITLTVNDPPTDNPNRAGYTVRDDAKCTVEFSKALQSTDKTDYWESVFLHEVYGHCLGLGHTQAQGSIMYPTTAKYQTYSKDALDSFFKSALAMITK
jgi:hypothetical protein